MRKIILDLAVVLGGYIEGTNGEIDWRVSDEETDFDDIRSNILADTDIIFYGRVSYEKWGNYQPGKMQVKNLRKLMTYCTVKQSVFFQQSAINDAILLNKKYANSINQNITNIFSDRNHNGMDCSSISILSYYR